MALLVYWAVLPSWCKSITVGRDFDFGLARSASMVSTNAGVVAVKPDTHEICVGSCRVCDEEQSHVVSILPSTKSP